MKLFHDTWLIFRRSMKGTLRSPSWAIFALFTPVCNILLFTPFLRGVENTPGFPPGGAINIYAPGILVMLGLLSASFVGFGLINDMREGVIERFRVTPLNPLAVPLGMTLRDVLVLCTQSFLVVLVAWPLGLNVNLIILLLMVVILTFLGLMTSSISYALALSFMNENVIASTINMATLPLAILSGITLPLAIAPEWMRTVSFFNPLAHVVEAARAVFNHNYDDGAVLRGIVVLVVCSGLSLLWAARAFRRAV